MNGFTDLKCCPIWSTSILDAIATIEMKEPFSKRGLCKTPAFQPKQQFVGQALALMQMAPCACKLSFLTHVFALSVAYHANGKVFLSKCVTDGTAFCLRLLLMCCNLSSDDWAGLIEADCVAMNFDEAVDTVPHSNSLNPTTAERSVTRSVTRDNEQRVKNNGVSESKEHDTCCGTFEWDEEEEDITVVRRWEAKCKGINFLGEDELRQHNMTML